MDEGMIFPPGYVYEPPAVTQVVRNGEAATRGREHRLGWISHSVHDMFGKAEVRVAWHLRNVDGDVHPLRSISIRQWDGIFLAPMTAVTKSVISLPEASSQLCRE